MIRHLFTLIWNRKRSNFLLVTEIVLSFFVLFVVSSMLVYNYYNYRQPLGYDYQNVWEINLNPGVDTVGYKQKLMLLVQRLKASKGVIKVAKTNSNTPFSFNNMNGHLYYKHKQSPITENYDVDDDFRDVLKLNVVEGRWFDRRDAASTRKPVIINLALKNAMFPGEKAVGKIFTDEKGTTEWQVVGVVNKYRAGSDFAEDAPASFRRRPLEDEVTAKSASYEIPVLLVRVQPGSGAVLEQQLIKEITDVTKSWSVTVTSLEQNRVSKLKVVVTPFIALGLVCGFLILNVTLGLFGVLWYNINQRRAEIGIRRALGATGNAIGSQFLGEMLVVTTLGVVVGLVLAMQFPLLGVFSVASTVYFQAMILATLLIFSLTAICAWQPSRIAASVQPAVSLREE
ncbi:FtsX-like permease family protein [Hymenobacter volaticus]|uniref:ABC transporter permease n=1 Tax=Hymenobacter volaticus TaxID=2932254 RepID=A0ABY4GAU1_9BACT|nr:FtsX-like permease family protein [Hymenobacter volaticus]UOQ68024.1 ABC transporter permease [Hymenobacter volaticus]